MVNKGEELPVRIVEHFRGGEGEVLVKDLTAGSKPANVLVCSELTLFKGCSVGYHEHRGDSEILYIVSGKGVYSSSYATRATVHAGDALVCLSGGSHALANEEDEPLKCISFIVAQ